MQLRFASLPTVEQVKSHVLQTLCERDYLDPEQTALHQALLVRKGAPCGILFQVQGPRRLRNYAVWAGEEDRILFYDSTGVRVAETRVCEGPDLASIDFKAVARTA